MELHKIKAEDLIFSGEIEDDRTNTFLELDDYDWMNYSLTTKFCTADMGTLNVQFEYFGMTISQMTVIKAGTGEKVVYEYSTDIFTKHLVNYMQNHIKSWDSEYAFDGENEVIEFFNDVLENHVSMKTAK